jgi:ATP-binding cassette subfamily B protein
MVNMIQRGAVSLGRINEVLDTKPSIVSPAAPKRPASGGWDYELELRNLSFSYGGDTALDAISARIRRGSWVGILGRTGSGKSTLIKTLTRTVDPPPGTVFVRGVDVRDWDLGELRSLFAVTPQDSYLFSDSIRNNTGYGLEEDDEERVRRAAKLAALEKDLSLFARGWDTTIGERGLTLSGGQKQRTAISRALVMDADFLILDDSLSSVDAETEKRILMGLLEERERRLSEGRPFTALIVSHRVSTLAYADLVLALDQGRIAESGSPRELLEQGGLYARTAEFQRLTAGGGLG